MEPDGLPAGSSFYVDAGGNIVMERVLLARHALHADLGVRLSGRSDIALSAEGREQAGRLAARLASQVGLSVYSSPRRRALETAGAVAAFRRRQVEVADAVDEIDFGEWTGSRFDALEADPRWQHWNEARDSASAPGGETMVAVVERAVRFVQAIAVRGPALVVTHCDIIRGVVCHYLGLPLERLHRFEIAPASLTRLEVGGGGGRIVCLNACC